MQSYSLGAREGQAILLRLFWSPQSSVRTRLAAWQKQTAKHCGRCARGKSGTGWVPKLARTILVTNP